MRYVAVIDMCNTGHSNTEQDPTGAVCTRSASLLTNELTNTITWVVLEGPSLCPGPFRCVAGQPVCCCC